MLIRETKARKRSRFLNRGSFDVYGKNKWVLLGQVRYYSAILGKTVVIPAGFTFDFASIPRILRPLIPKEGYHRYAALVHDWLYYSHEVDRETADLLFREAMGVLKTPQWKRNTMYRGVKWFGSSSYGKRMYTPDPERIVNLSTLPDINRKYRR